jgi:predicted PurR-regulated permease PerM
VVLDIHEFRRRVRWTIALTAAAVVLLWAAYQARGALLLIYVSILFAIGFSPLVRLLERQRLLPIGTRRLPRWLAILTIYLAIIGIVVAIGAMVVPPMIRQAQQLWDQLPSMLDRAQRALLERGLIDHPMTVREAVEHAPGTGTDAVGTVFSAVSGFIGGVFGVVTILILSFYLLIEANVLFDAFLRLVPRARRQQVAEASRQIAVKVSAWLIGQLLLGGIIGASAAIGLWAMGVPYFYVLALIAGIGELIPIIGPLLSAVPAVAVAFTESPRLGLMVIAFYFLQQQFENHILVPKVMERQVGVSASMVIIALLVGGSLLGIVGAILAVPTAAILQVIFLEITARNDG